MESTFAYLPGDRRLALAHGLELPAVAWGAVLFADISGFSKLFNDLVQHYGARRGADEFTRRLNTVYSAVIAEVERFGGSVIGFSGDAITCWYAAHSPFQGNTAETDGETRATLCAIASALAMQQAMIAFRSEGFLPDPTLRLALKTAVAAGWTRRFRVGTPTIQYIDVLAGQPLDRMAAAEQMARQGELVLDAATADTLADELLVTEWRVDHAGNRFAVVGGIRPTVEPPPPPEDAAVPDAEVQRWVLPSIYQRLGDEQSRFLAELRPAVALFLKFSGLDYDGDPAAGDKLDAYIRWVQAVVNRFEGALIQLTTGDKGSYLYAAFGAPIAHDDDSLRAVAAALELRSTPATFPFIQQVQIGLSQGMMRTGAYGSSTRRTYGVLGDVTNMAARLMSHARPGQIVVSRAVADAVADSYELEELGPVKLKGWDEAQRVMAVRGLLQRPGERSFSRFVAPLVGRATELAILIPLLDPLMEGQGRFVRLEGSAGVGKSHLGATFAAQATARGVTVVRALCQSTSQDIAYSAAAQLVRGVLDLPSERPEAEQMAHVEAALQALNPAWLVRMPLLGDLLGLPIADNPTTAAFEPRLRQEALITLVAEIIHAEARLTPHLLLFEDIHWMDEASQGVLLALARTVSSAPLLVMVLHRPPVRDGERFLAEVAGLPNQLYLPVHELPADGLEALVSHRLQGQVDPLALALIQTQTQGNPFFAEELVDALRDAGHLIGGAAGWHLATSLVEALRNADCLVEREGKIVLAPDAPLSAVDMGLPSTVQGIVLARLDRLPEQAKLTLKVASVIGAIFEEELLVQAHPLHTDEVTLGKQMNLLLARDFARIEMPGPHAKYSFKHNITQEVAYQTLLEDQRQELHQSVAEVLEHQHGDRIEDLAFHFARCDLARRPVRDKALYYLDAAGRRAKHDYANETALSYFNRALALEARWPWLKAKIEVLHILGRRPEERQTLDLLQAAPNAPGFDTAMLWGEYYEAISEYDQAQQEITEAMAQAQQLGDAEGEARCLARLGMIAWRKGDYERAEQSYNQALGVLGNDERFGDEEADVRYGLGLVYRRQGKYDEAQEQFERDLVLNRQLADRQNEARSLDALGHVEQLRRNPEQAIAFYRQALEIRQTIGDRGGVGVSLLSMAQGWGNLGDYGRAEPLLLQAMKIHQALNNRWWEMLVWTELGILYFMIGQFEKAKTCFTDGRGLSQEIGDQSGEAYLLCNIGQVLRDKGELEQADAVLTQGLQLAKGQGDVLLEAICLSDLAVVSLHRHHYPEAIERAQASNERFTSLELERSTTSGLATLAVAHLALGHPAPALTAARETTGILDECDGEGADFPHRDYWMCSQVFQSLGETILAHQALNAAYRLLMRRTGRISDPDMRKSFLENISYHRSIMQAVS